MLQISFHQRYCQEVLHDMGMQAATYNTELNFRVTMMGKITPKYKYK
jgi:hypothetical protein